MNESGSLDDPNSNNMEESGDWSWEALEEELIEPSEIFNIATRLRGSDELMRCYAESLYERYCHRRLGRIQPNFDSLLFRVSNSPSSLQDMALEAYRKRRFIAEWVLANKASLAYDFVVMDVAEVFGKAYDLLLLNREGIKALVSKENRCHLR